MLVEATVPPVLDGRSCISLHRFVVVLSMSPSIRQLLLESLISRIGLECPSSNTLGAVWVPPATAVEPSLARESPDLWRIFSCFNAG